MGNSISERLLSEIYNTALVDRSSTILIEMPAYRDEQVVQTVVSAIKQADNPNRVHIAICYQDDDMTNYHILESIDNVKLVHVPLSEARGSCYARYLCQKMLTDEEFVLRIDSHMRFVKHWDTMMIKQWKKCNDDRAVLSTYLPGFSSDMLSADVTDSVFDKPVHGFVLRALLIDNNMRVWFRSRYFNELDVLPKKNVWISGHYVFCRSDYDKDILFDPDMYFVADEVSMAIRTYTKGYTVYNPQELYIYHLYGGQRQQRFMPDETISCVQKTKESEYKRICALFGVPGFDNIDLGDFGLGDVHTLQEWERLSGLSLRNHTMSYKCWQGLYYESCDNQILPNVLFNRDLYNQHMSRIHVIIQGLTAQYVNTAIKNICDTALYHDRLDFIAVVPEYCRQDCVNADTVKYSSDSTCYSGYFASVDAAMFSDDDYVLYIDSDCCFTCNGWDEYLIEQQMMCGKNSVVSQYADSKHMTAAHNNKYPNIIEFSDKWISYSYKIVEKSGNFFPILSSGFMFTRASVVKSCLIDPNLDYLNHLICYSLRLWTNGYDIYHSGLSFICSRKNKIVTVQEHSNMLDYLTYACRDNSLDIPADYSYSIGPMRSSKKWEQLVGINCMSACLEN